MTFIWLTVLGAVSTLGLGIGGGMAPYWCLAPSEGSAEGARREVKLRLANMFAGGVLLGAGFCHLLPDLVVAAEELGLHHTPFPYLFALLGLLVPFALERSPLLQLCCGHAAQEATGVPSVARAVPVNQDGGSDEELACLTRSDKSPVWEAAEIEEDPAPKSYDTSGGGVAVSSSRDHNGMAADSSPRGDGSHGGPTGDPATARARRGDSFASTEMAATEMAYGGHAHAHVPDMRKGQGVALLLVLTLSVHSLMEGVGMGVQDELASSIGIMLAVVGHKGFAAFALGMSFRTAGASMRDALRGVIVFAIMTPCGIVLGAVLKAGLHSPWVDMVAVGLATGTFIYVSVVEILEEELRRTDGNALSKASIFMAGVALFAILGFVLAA